MSERPPVEPGYFPAFLRLTGARVLVVGGDATATAEVRRLLASGATVVVVDSIPCAALLRLAAAGEVILHRRHFCPGDLAGAGLCLVALNDRPAADAVAAAADAAGVLAGVAGRPAQADLLVPDVDGCDAPGDEDKARRPAARRGRATLVGAGPGDPGLLTLRALQALECADVVLYDALIDRSILDLAPRRARRIDVGKRCGRHAMNQTAINRLILQHTQTGAHVVRLKGGDPFVFGRGGEELGCLRAAGVPVEVVPGVTAACAAAASLGVPLTHRGLARSLHFVTGHGADGAVPAHDWAASARAGGTIAAYMASRTLELLAARLVAAGLPGSTPAVAGEHASRPQQRHLFGTLATLPGLLAAQDFDGPTLVLIGDVVALAAAQRQPALPRAA
ncbi:MAG TPA: uroporphyrinogen-III C-methyltransferase [Acetobacteraceae bacterium]|nr:uroporphyrinogen-III C-methyltransferase [Acetobacteraceae bacterium]